MRVVRDVQRGQVLQVPPLRIKAKVARQGGENLMSERKSRVYLQCSQCGALTEVHVKIQVKDDTVIVSIGHTGSL